MTGESIKVTIISSDERNIETDCKIGELNNVELLAAVGTLVSDCVTKSELDIENFIAAIRWCYNNNF